MDDRASVRTGTTYPAGGLIDRRTMGGYVGRVRALQPVDGSVDPLTHLLNRARAAPPGRTWVTTNMILSLDGAIAAGGRSGPLGVPADRVMFRALRSACDAVLVGAGTARSEQYRLPTTPDDHAAARARAGLPPHPRLVIISRSLRFEGGLPAFEAAGPGPAPLVYTSGADRRSDDRRPPAGRVEVVEADEEGELNLHAVLADLHTRGHRTVLCEGGPTLLGALHAADLIDEYRVTLGPIIVGGNDHGAVHGRVERLQGYRLSDMFEGDDALLLGYLRDRARPAREA